MPMTPLRSAAAVALFALLALAPTVFAQTSPAPRTVEFLSYGHAIADLQIVVGSKELKASLGMIPPGVSMSLGTAKSVSLSLVETVKDKARVIPLATVALPAELISPLVLVVPPEKNSDSSAAYETRVVDQDLPLKPGVLNIYNLTPVVMMIQSGPAETPVAVPAWGKGTFTPKVDRKARGHIRVAYAKPDGSWAVVKDSATAFRTGFFCRMRIVLAAEGLGALADVLSYEHNAALVYIDEQQIQLPGPVDAPPPGEAPAYKPPYEKVDVILPTADVSK